MSLKNKIKGAIERIANSKPTDKPNSVLAEEQLSHFDFPILAWNSTAFNDYHRPKNWYIVIGVLMFLLIASGIFLGSPTFAIAVIVFAMVYVFINTSTKNKPYQILISDVGIKFGDKIYGYNQIKTFWIEYEPPYYQSLHIVLNGDFTQDLTINFHGINPSEIRSVLSSYLPEWEERKLSLSEQIIRYLGL